MIENDHDHPTIKKFIEKTFVGSILREEHSDMLTYHLPQSNLMKWSELFGLMEFVKVKYDIEDYSLGQTSLEQIFLYFDKNESVIEDEYQESTKLTTRL